MKTDLTTKECRIHLIGTPEEIAPHIRRVAEQLHFQGQSYYLSERSGSDQFSKTFCLLFGKYNRLVSSLDEEQDKDDAHEIAEITLQSLPNNKALFISKLSVNNSNDDTSSYGEFLNNLFAELKQLGFKEPWLKKAWRAIKEIVGVAQAAKP